jgi:tetratricopeptide (TPR) repeat protein
MQEHLDAATRLAGRLPEKERLALLGWKATVEHRPEEARRLRDQAAAAYPEDKEAVFWAADIPFHRGDMAAGVPGLERALKLDPNYVLAWNHLAMAYEDMGMPEKQLEVTRRWVEVAHSAEANRWMGRALLSLDRRDEAEAAFRRAHGIDGKQWPAGAVASWFLSQGRAHDAEVMAREGLAEARKRPAPAKGSSDAEPFAEAGWYARLLVASLAQQGRIRDAQAAIDEMARSGIPANILPGLRLIVGSALRSPALVRAAAAEADRAGLFKTAPPLVSVATDLALLGAPEEAAALMERARAAPDWPDVGPADLVAWDVVTTWRAGRLADAEARLLPYSATTSAPRRYGALNALGEIQIQLGKDADGAATLERARTIRWPAGGEGRGLQEENALFLLAGAYERLGERQKGLDRVDELLRLWQRADPDLPRLAEAKALKKRLSPRTAQATQR